MKKIIITNGKKVILRVTISGCKSVVDELYSELNSVLFGYNSVGNNIKKEAPIKEPLSESVLTQDNNTTN